MRVTFHLSCFSALKQILNSPIGSLILLLRERMNSWGLNLDPLLSQSCTDKLLKSCRHLRDACESFLPNMCCLVPNEATIAASTVEGFQSSSVS